MATTSVETLPVLPLPDGVVFPEMVVTVAIASSEASEVVKAASGGRLLLVPRLDGKYSSTGVIATIVDRDTRSGRLPTVTVRALGRAKVGSGVVGSAPVLWVEVEPVADEAPTAEIETLAAGYRAAATSLLDKVGGRQLAGALRELTTPGALADSIGYWPELSLEQRVELLETIDVADRLRLATGWIKGALADLEVQERIRQEVNDDLEQGQREAILRRQLAAIRSELGDGDEDVIGQYRAKLENLTQTDDGDSGAESAPPESTVDAIAREIDRLERTGNESMEANWIRTWLDTVFELPWTQRSQERLDLTEARAILDADHTGLEDVKDRLVEHLAVRKLRAERGVSDEPGDRRRGVILALVGPPGVGKTSLGESVARALGRSFVRVALGGVRDEAEIRGHRRTYVGARPGRLVRALTEAQSMNPVILLDEIDKVSGGWQGDPSAALLEVLDPAQNHSFRDHYLEFELDLSDIVFIATANVLETIPGPLLDRMELITLDGYTESEKASIATDHLLPRLIRRNGLVDGEVVFSDEAIASIVGDYTREAGVRRLERLLDKAIRKSAMKIVESSAVNDGADKDSADKDGADKDSADKDSADKDSADKDSATGTEGGGDREQATTVIEPEDLGRLLGRPIPAQEVEDRIDRPGIATGLAVTGAGGDVLFVETALVEGEGEPLLTGQLGDVMKESASIVRSIVSSQGHRFDVSLPADKRLHVHFPAGAVPKDGPSAGVTMTTALVSLLSGRLVRSDVAMTGEVTLQGRVLPIGGVKQKVLAAHRAGITTVILPDANGADLEDVPTEVQEAMTIHLASHIDDVLAVALEPTALNPTEALRPA